MNITPAVRLFLFASLLPPLLAFAQQHPPIQRPAQTVHEGACAAFPESVHRFEAARERGEKVSALRQVWIGYQRESKVKQKDFLDAICLTAWDEYIFVQLPSLINAAKIPVQPDEIWGDITSDISLLKTAIEHEQDEELAEKFRSRLERMETSLTSKDPHYTVLPNFIEATADSLQMHTTALGSKADGFWPVIAVKNRAMFLAMNNVALTCDFFDSSHKVVRQTVVTTKQILPQETVKLVDTGIMMKMGADGQSFADAVKTGSFSCSRVQFEIEPGHKPSLQSLGLQGSN